MDSIRTQNVKQVIYRVRLRTKGMSLAVLRETFLKQSFKLLKTTIFYSPHTLTRNIFSLKKILRKLTVMLRSRAKYPLY
jgi:hypothetical protein